MTNTERDAINRHFAELVGLCWHIYGYSPNDPSLRVPRCPKCQIEIEYNFHNPDFVLHPTLVLREMMRREDWPEFSKVSGFWNVPFQARTKYFINVDYILDETEGLLLKAAIEFLERSQKP